MQFLKHGKMRILVKLHSHNSKERKQTNINSLHCVNYSLKDSNWIKPFVPKKPEVCPVRGTFGALGGDRCVYLASCPPILSSCLSTTVPPPQHPYPNKDI